MSRIFDALQRSERERSGTDSVVLPEGAEMLKRAERHAASKWNGNGAIKEVEVSTGANLNLLLETGVTFADSPISETPPESEAAPAAGEQELFQRFEPLPISLSAQSRLVCLTDRDSPTAEALRLLGVRLRDRRRIRPLKTVLITSTIPQEGKSTIASNLACTLSSAAQERTLLVEGDLRRPSLMTIFGVRSSRGLCDYLREENGLEKTIYHLQGAGIWILPAGHLPTNPLEFLQSPRLTNLMEKVAEYFDWIVIDSPPVLPLADTSVWMRLSDGILLVTRQGTTEKRQLQKGMEALDRKKLLGAVLNGTIASAYSGYYYRTPDQS
jgi:capsular exopolysaccharide synthesis family protein